jgi:alanyl-tRNA synthetase
MATRRLYYDDAFEREFTAEVVSCDPEVHNAASVWAVTLDRTAFYPASGGQPHDLGKLGDANVLDVREAEGEIVHIVDRPLQNGTVNGCISWPRRFDHMQQHTGQHLLSAMFLERFGLPTVSFHLGAEISTIDLRGPEPSEEILEGAERAANQIIFEDRPVTVRYGTAEELAQLGVRKDVDRAGILRAIEIEAADLQPCGGTHVKHTGQMGIIQVRRRTKVRKDWRVEFVCGTRAERAGRRDFLLLARVAERFSCAPEEVISAADRTLLERDANFKNARAALQRLAEAEATLTLEVTPPGRDGLRIIWRVIQGAQPEFLGFFATELTKTERVVALLASHESGHICFAQHSSAGKDMAGLLKQVVDRFGGKGGGPRDFVRARLDNASQCEGALALAKDLLSDEKHER